jgi:hypothetical protein
MAKYEVTSPDGQKFEVTAPDSATQDEVQTFVMKTFGGKPKPAPTTAQKVQASAPGRVVQGMRDSIDAGAQLLPRGLEMLTSLGGAAPNKVSDFFGAEAKRVDAMNAKGEAEYQAARTATGQEGFDGARLIGNIVSPTNAAIAAKLPAAATALGRVGQGVVAGGIGGALQPVDVTEEGASFAGKKAAQIGIGAAAGGVLTPLAGKIGDAFGRWVASRRAQVVDITSLERTLRQIADDAGTKWEDMAPQVQQQLRGQVKTALTTGGRLDPAAVARKADFDAEGMQGTLGQITRDARQFADEKNLRQLPGTGAPLLSRFENQGKQLQDKVGAFAAGSKEAYPAGKVLSEAASKALERRSADVSAAYRLARAQAGKDAEVPLQGLAQDAADIFDRYRSAVPSGIRGQFAKYGMDPDEVVNQRKLFTVEEADKLMREINKQGSNEPAVMSALSELRSAVKKAITNDAGVDDVFAPARKKAAELFALRDAVPALEAAQSGKVAADDFVKRFVIDGKTEEVAGLAKILKAEAPEAFSQARAQIGDELRKAAFGQNAAGDKAFSAERYLQTLRRIGTDKLKPFYSDAEISQLERLGRLGAYINQFPNAAPVQTSGNFAALMNIAGRIPGISQAVAVGKAAKTAVTNDRSISAALKAEVPKAAPELSAKDVEAISKLLRLTAVGAGATAAEPIK